MPHSFGYRAATRTLFKKAFKTNGRCPTTTYLRNFKVALEEIMFFDFMKLISFSFYNYFKPAWRLC